METTLDLFEELRGDSSYIWREFHNYNKDRLESELTEFENMIREYNLNIPDVEEQIIITNPFYYNKIVGCTRHFAAEISGHKVKDIDGTFALFTGWNIYVLSKEGRQQTFSATHNMIML